MAESYRIFWLRPEAALCFWFVLSPALLLLPAGAEGLAPEPVAVLEPFEPVATASAPAACVLPGYEATKRRPKAEPVSPWFLQLGRNERGSNVSMNYVLRWDEDDLKHTPGTILARLRDPLASFDWTVRGMAEGTRLDLYGVHVRPFRGIFGGGPPVVGEPGGAGGAGADAGASQPSRRRGWLELDPFVDELRQSATRDARRWLIRSAFDRALPNSRGAAQWQKEGLAGGMLNLQRSWTEDGATR